MKAKHLLPLFILLLCSCSQQKKCRIEGRVIDRPEADILRLAPYNTDYRVIDAIEIPVNKDGSFSYALEFESPELYTIVYKYEVLNGAFSSCPFMLEDAKVDITLYPDNDSTVYLSLVRGGVLNDSFFYLDREFSVVEEIRKLYNILYEDLDEKAYSSEYLEWIAELDNSGSVATKRDSLLKIGLQFRNDNAKYSAEGLEILNQVKQIKTEADTKILSEIKKDADESGLAVLYRYVVRNGYSFDAEKNAVYKDILYSVFSEDYSQNPMYSLTEEMILAAEVAVGSRFVDFSAPDLDGNTHQLSELIKGKVVVLDLWASWCGPCMRTSESFIPVWEKYKDKGFDIVGVARENNNTEAMVAAIDRLKLPWLNLVELNDKAKIWAKYSAGNGGGKVILIDQKGVIVDINFDAKELEEHLAQLL